MEIYRLLLKFLGLYFLVTIVSAILNPISAMILDRSIVQFIWPMFIQVLYAIIVFWLFFIKTDWILRILKIENGNEDDLIEFKDAKNEPIWDFAVVLVGGLLIVKHFPIFLSNLIYQFQTMSGLNEVTASYMTDMKIRIAINLFGMIVGYLMITNRQRISKWIAKFGDRDKTHEI